MVHLRPSNSRGGSTYHPAMSEVTIGTKSESRHPLVRLSHLGTARGLVD
jgi:hypothetical protein